MKVKEDLVYNKHTGQVVGFASLGDVHGDLSNMELKCTGNSPHPPVSTHILVMMVRQISFKLEHPYAHFATKGVTVDVLFPLV